MRISLEVDIRRTPHILNIGFYTVEESRMNWIFSNTHFYIQRFSFSLPSAGPKSDVKQVRRNLFMGDPSKGQGKLERHRSVAVMESTQKPPTTPNKRIQKTHQTTPKGGKFITIYHCVLHTDILKHKFSVI